VGGFVYIMTNGRDGTLYTGVTANLSRRIHEHRTEQVKGFTARYGLHRLVYYEAFDDIRIAIQREKTLKHWPREWKLSLIHDLNPDWNDLYETLNW
jgi:putative endonuclease